MMMWTTSHIDRFQVQTGHWRISFYKTNHVLAISNDYNASCKDHLVGDGILPCLACSSPKFSQETLKSIQKSSKFSDGQNHSETLLRKNLPSHNITTPGKLLKDLNKLDTFSDLNVSKSNPDAVALAFKSSQKRSEMGPLTETKSFNWRWVLLKKQIQLNRRWVLLKKQIQLNWRWVLLKKQSQLNWRWVLLKKQIQLNWRWVFL